MIHAIRELVGVIDIRIYSLKVRSDEGIDVESRQRRDAAHLLVEG